MNSKLLLLLLQMSFANTCFNAAWRKSLHKRWEIQCLDGFQIHGMGRENAVAR